MKLSFTCKLLASLMQGWLILPTLTHIRLPSNFNQRFNQAVLINKEV